MTVNERVSAMNKNNKKGRGIRLIITIVTACACALGLLAPVSVSAAGSGYGVETSIEADAEMMEVAERAAKSDAAAEEHAVTAAAEEESIPAAAEGNAIPGAAAEEGEKPDTAAEETTASDRAAEDPEPIAALPEEDALGQEVPQDLSEAELLADEAAAEEALGASEFSYVSVNGGISVTGYNGTAANVTIPSSINGKTVVSIGEEAFRQKPVTRVTLPATLTSIGRKCFYGCESLEVVNLESCPSLETIGAGAVSP